MRITAPLLLAFILAAPTVRGEAPPPATTPLEEPPPESRADLKPLLRNTTPAQLFASVEESWATGDAEALSALVDTTTVRIGLKPGPHPTAAMTRSAATFLFHDQLRLVTTQSFQILKFNVGKSSSTATARWLGDWGGRQGVRRIMVTLTAVPVAGRWYLREVRARD